MKEIWYKAHHEMSKSTKSTFRSPNAIFTDEQQKATPQYTHLYLRFAELHYSLWVYLKVY